MVKVLIILKTGEIKNSRINDVGADSFYKKCGLKDSSDFCLRHTWCYNNSYISILAKDSGRSGMENKYDLPPPLDKSDILYFGKMLLIKHENKSNIYTDLLDITNNEWGELYDKLFGGFEDLGDTDSFSEEEDIPKELQTKDGYMKDGFVVDSDDDIEELKSESDVNSNGEISDNDENDMLMGSESDIDSGEDYNSDDNSDYSDNESLDSLGSELSEESYDSD